MICFGKSKTEKMIMKLERVMMSVEMAYDKGKYDVARYAAREELKILRWLHEKGEWTEEKVTACLADRGLVRSITDEKYRDEISDKLMLID